MVPHRNKKYFTSMFLNPKNARKLTLKKSFSGENKERSWILQKLPLLGFATYFWKKKSVSNKLIIDISPYLQNPEKQGFYWKLSFLELFRELKSCCKICRFHDRQKTIESFMNYRFIFCGSVKDFLVSFSGLLRRFSVSVNR